MSALSCLLFGPGSLVPSFKSPIFKSPRPPAVIGRGGVVGCGLSPGPGLSITPSTLLAGGTDGAGHAVLEGGGMH